MRGMTEPPAFPAERRSRLWRFVLPVLAAHALLFASLPYWPTTRDSGPGEVSIELAPLATDTPTASQPAPANDAPPVRQASKPEQPARTESPPERQPPPRQPPVPAEVATQAPTNPTPHTTATETTPSARFTEPAPPRSAGAAPAQASPPAGGAPAGSDAYLAALHAALARAHHYPPRARRFGLTGTATVRFTITRDGRFTRIALAQGTGHELLDEAALDTVRQVGRFRPLPEGYSADGWTVSVPLVYRLD